MDTRVGPVVEDGAIVGVTLVASDTTARRHAEHALRASQQQYQTLIDVLPDAVFVHVGGKITYANRAFLRMFGKTLEEVLGRSPLDIAHPDDRVSIRERIAKVADGGSIGPVPAKFTGADGSMKPVSLVAATVPGYDEPAIVVVLHDLTALQRSDLMLRSVLESVGDAILTIDTHGIVLNINPATTRLFGYSPEEMIGNNIKMLVPENIREHHDGYLDAYLRTGVAKIVGVGREVVAICKDGSTLPCDLMVSSFKLNGKIHFTGVMRDIRARKRLEEQFRQAHKMEAFGQLAGGVAHDFNNLLTVILGATEMIAASVTNQPMKDELRTSVHDIQESARRATDLTRQLLAFSRKTVLEPKLLDINASIQETEKILRRLIGEDIALVTQLEPDLPRVFVDPGQLSQVVMNLCLNARDAMPAGGRLVLQTSRLALEGAQAEARGLTREGAYVRLAVRDSGTGMTEEVLGQVFQPFFTTKEVGRGTGLGLAVVHGVVTQSGGSVSVQSAPGHGSTFEILLPAAPVAARSASDTATLKPMAGHETVLVVEDDEDVRRLAVRSLKSRGYNVLVAEDGEAALRVLEEKAATIDIAVVDVVMPRMDGGRLATIMAQRFPAVPVLFVSGYTDDMLESRGLDAAQLNFLNKPYTAGTLTQAVRRVLEHRPTSSSDST
jgi:PAS domain S-box-containing protein